MKRFVLLILASLMIFTVSCAAAENGSREQFDVDFSADDGKIDLNGYDFQIRFYNYTAPEDGSVLGYKANSGFFDAAVKRIGEVESEYNCTISTSNSPSVFLENDFTPVLMAGLYFTDAIMSSSYSLRPQIESLLFEPLSLVSDIINYRDSQKWGNWKLLEQSVWDGDIYGVVPVQWPDVAVSGGFMFLFNEKFAKSLGQPDPRTFVEDGSWSRDKLGEMMTTYTTEDLGHPLKALLTYEGHFFDTALRANNAQAYKLVNGQYVSGYHTPEGQEALEWADNFLHTEYRDCTYPCPADKREDVFINEDVAMFFTICSDIFCTDAKIPFEVDDFCVLPMPNGPEREKEHQPYTTFMECIHNNLLFPINGNIEASAVIANALFEPLEGFDEEGLKEYYLRYYYHDERDYYAQLEVFTNNRYSFVSDGIRGLVVEKLYGIHKNSVTEILEATEDAQNELVQKYLVPTVSSLEAIFGAEALEK